MDMIVLHCDKERTKQIFVNPEKIITLQPHANGTSIVMDAPQNGFSVTETSGEIMNMIYAMND